MAQYTIEANGHVFDIESDTAPTEADIKNILASQGIGDASFAPSAPDEEEWGSDEWKAKKDAQIRQELKDFGRGFADNLAAFGYNLGDTALFGLPSYINSKLLSDDQMQDINEFLKQHSTPAGAGDLAGFLTPGGLPMKGINLATKAAAKTSAKIGANVASKGVKKAIDWSVKAGATAVAMESEAELQKTMQKAAFTKEFETGEEAMNNIAGNTAWNIAFQGVLGGTGAIAKKIYGLASKTAKATRVMGGVDNIKKAQANYDRAIMSGATDKEAADVFMASIAQGLQDEELRIFQRLIQTSPELAKFARDQMAGANGIVTNTIMALTKADYAKYSRELLKNLYGPEYRNAIGATDADYSANGLKRLLGTDNASKALEERGKALARAEQKMMNPEVNAAVKGEFKALRDDLMSAGSADYERMASKIEAADLKSFAGSEAEAEAREALANKIQQIQEATGQPVSAEMAAAMENQAMRQGARRHLDKIMTEGADTVRDINDIKEFFKRVNEAEVREGQSAAVGAFNEGVNSRILDKLDQVLYESNQALRYEKTLMDMHKFGGSYTPARANELESLLYNGTSANEAAMKLTAFKMGYLNKMTETAINGDREAFNRLREVVKSKRELGKYFEEGELEQYFTQLKPKIEAANSLRGLIAASEQFIGQPSMAPQMVRMGIGAINQSTNILGNAAVSWVQKLQFGPGTAKRILQFAENPSAANMNLMIKNTKDALERMQLGKAIVNTLEEGAIEQALIRQTLH